MSDEAARPMTRPLWAALADVIASGPAGLPVAKTPAAGELGLRQAEALERRGLVELDVATGHARATGPGRHALERRVAATAGQLDDVERLADALEVAGDGIAGVLTLDDELLAAELVRLAPLLDRAVIALEELAQALAADPGTPVAHDVPGDRSGAGNERPVDDVELGAATGRPALERDR